MYQNLSGFKKALEARRPLDECYDILNERRKEMKFKVGDTIRIIGREISGSAFPIGTTGIINKIECKDKKNGQSYDIRVDKYHFGQSHYESELELVTSLSVTAGLNKDDGKLRVDLVPTSAIRAIAEVLGGACASGKYPARNWEKGISYSRIYANVLRHLMSWYDGEDKDKESGLHPLKHALCRLAMLVEYIEKNKEEFDDRPGKKS